MTLINEVKLYPNFTANIIFTAIVYLYMYIHTIHKRVHDPSVHVYTHTNPPRPLFNILPTLARQRPPSEIAHDRVAMSSLATPGDTADKHELFAHKAHTKQKYDETAARACGGGV